jgi:hypothetical protein
LFSIKSVGDTKTEKTDTNLENNKKPFLERKKGTVKSAKGKTRQKADGFESEKSIDKPTSDIELKDSENLTSQLLYWEHSKSLVEFWKKFLQRIQVFCNQEDYIFLFIKRDKFESTSLKSLDELDNIIGLKGSIFLSSSYMKENSISSRLSLSPLLRIKGSLSPNRALLQLPLVSTRQIFGALLICRRIGQLSDGQIKQIWNEINSLSNDILKVKQFDKALRDDASGLFNLRHFQYSISKAFKLKGNIPSRSLFLFQIKLPVSKKNKNFNKYLRHLGNIFWEFCDEDEEVFLLKTENSKIIIAVLGESKPLDNYEVKLNTLYQRHSFLEKNKIWLNGGSCSLNDDIYSARRWLDQGFITLQEGIHRGPNYIVQSSSWKKSDYIKIQWQPNQKEKSIKK